MRTSAGFLIDYTFFDFVWHFKKFETCNTEILGKIPSLGEGFTNF